MFIGFQIKCLDLQRQLFIPLHRCWLIQSSSSSSPFFGPDSSICNLLRLHLILCFLLDSMVKQNAWVVSVTKLLHLLWPKTHLAILAHFTRVPEFISHKCVLNHDLVVYQLSMDHYELPWLVPFIKESSHPFKCLFEPKCVQCKLGTLMCKDKPP